jgi:putative acetyltransferase
MDQMFQGYRIRDWQVSDRIPAAEVIHSVLTEYGLAWEPEGADLDVLDIETHYQQVGGEFWVVENQGLIVGTGAYYPVPRGKHAVEIRKMYLRPAVRGQGLGYFLLRTLEATITERGYRQIWVETASVLAAAVQLYQRSGYLPATGVETQRCDLVFTKHL